jgi:predicted nucleic acid-binding protein
MDRLFLEANVLFSAAYSANAGLLQFRKLKNVVLCSSRYALEEAAINLAQEIQKRRLKKLAAAIEFFEPISRSVPQDLTLPDKDVPILLAAVAAQATHLITGDVRHFGRYFGKSIEGMLVSLPGDYLRKSGV